MKRPLTRGDCKGGIRPCPWVSCKHHLWLKHGTSAGRADTEEGMRRMIERPSRDWDELPESCSLDVADRGPHTLEDVGELLGLTRERVRQIEARAVAKLCGARRQLVRELAESVDGVVKREPFGHVGRQRRTPTVGD